MTDNKQDNKSTKSPNSGDPNKFKPKFNVYWIYGLIAVVFIGLQLLSFTPKPTEISMQEFERDMLKSGDVAKIVVVNKDKANIYIKADRLSDPRYKDLSKETFMGTSTDGPHYFFTIGSMEYFEQWMSEAQEGEYIEISYKTQPNYMKDVIGWLFPILIILAIWIFIFRRMSKGQGGAGGGNIFSVGKSKAQLFDKESNVKVDFKDVAGLEEAKVEVREIVDFLKTPKKYTDLGGKIPKGVLLVGPPGTGKTLMAKAVAGEANVAFFSMSGSDFVEMFVGVGASRVRDLFKQAKEKAPCIIFIDEIDAIGRARGKNPNFGANDERENTLNQLLTEMDGFGNNVGVIIMAATNRADILDKALMRAGRFDRQIHLELPDINERRDIFKVHLKPIKLETNLDVDFLAKQTPGFSGADIANVCNESALIAARKNKKVVEKQDFLDAVDRIVGGMERKTKIITKEEKKTIAFHEAGHATISWLLEHAHPLVKVTIIPRGRALGAAWYLPEERQITTRDQLLDEMCAALGGRVAEELMFGKISTGAMNDLEKITKQAYAMNAYFGMSEKIGHVSFYDSTGQSEMAFNKPYSEKTAELIDNEVKILIEKAYKRSFELLKKHKGELTELAEILLEKEVIFSEDLERIFGKRPWKTHHEKEAEVKKELDEKIKKEQAKLKKAKKKEAEIEEKEANNKAELEEKEENKIIE
ncbi:MAG: ATP-dependent zinc metalloprotease FtsH [Bacteroidales bacterium]|jgi:AFG3 family protein|nr:ATP-dependent zinc metalloprotease FtsH [Bacteroidales bacterium]